MSISSDDDTDSTELVSEYDSEHHFNLEMCTEDDMDALDSLELDGDADMERDGDNDEEEDEEEEDEDEEEDKDQDDGKEPRTIGHGEMVNSSADDVDSRVDDQPILLPEQTQEMHEHSAWTEPPAPAPRPHTLQPRA